MTYFYIAIATMAHMFGASTFDGDYYVVENEVDHYVMCLETADDVEACFESYGK